jgi:hypothetical protein
MSAAISLAGARIGERPPFWRCAIMLWLAGVGGACLLMPYVMSLPSFAAAEARTGLAGWQLVLISCAQTSVLMAIVVTLGLWASRKAGFTTPLLHAWLGRVPLPAGFARGMLISAFTGCVAGGLMLGLEVAVFKPAGVLALFAKQIATPPAPWRSVLASFYGAIDEEILLRLCLLSLIALGLRRLSGTSKAGLSSRVFWSANLIAALMFGLGHLPATAALVPLTTLVVLRALLLNGLGGIVFGALYLRFGLESAMVAHFCCDIMLHVLTAL